LYVGMRFEILLLGYSISDSQKIHKQLTNESLELEMRLAKYKDPALVVELAKRDHGLSDPGERVIYLE